MKNIDRQTLFTALAFFAVVQNGKDAADHQTAEQIRQLAGLAAAFCGENVEDVGGRR